MPKITAEMIKQIKARTDAGMLDCKKALEKTKGDIEEALELLTKTKDNSLLAVGNSTIQNSCWAAFANFCFYKEKGLKKSAQAS